MESCPATFWPGCKTPVASKGKLMIRKNDARPEGSRVSWSWAGEATMATELGNPTLTTGYRICGYDGGDNIIVDIAAAPGGTCGSRPCWKASGSGFKYQDRSSVAHELHNLSIKPGSDGRAMIKMKAKGAHLDLPDLPLTTAPNPVRLQLHNLENSVCWTASFSSALGDPSSTSKWKAKND